MTKFKVGDRIKIGNDTGVVTQVIDQGCDKLNFLRAKFDGYPNGYSALCFMEDCEIID